MNIDTARNDIVQAHLLAADRRIDTAHFVAGLINLRGLSESEVTRSQVQRHIVWDYNYNSEQCADYATASNMVDLISLALEGIEA